MFHSNTYATALMELVQNSTANVLIVYGDQDEFTGTSSYETWTKDLQVTAGGKGAFSVFKVKDATHFWLGSAGSKLSSIVEGWLP